MYYPGRIRKWNEKTHEFDHFEALNDNGSLVCTVDYSDDIKDKEVIVAVDTMLPYVTEENNYTNVSGYIGSIWNTLEETLEFKTKFKKTGELSVDEFLKGSSNVWLSAASIDKYFGGHCHYSHQIMTISYSLYARAVAARVSMWWYARIFQPELWAVTILYIIGISSFLFGMYRLKKMACSNFVECNNEFSGISFNFLCVLGGITGQGIQKLPSSWSLRFLILTSLTMGVLITCGFNSTLMSHLSIQSSRMPFTDLTDIYFNGRGSYSICVRRNDAPEAYLRNFEEQIKKNMSELGIEWHNIINRKCPEMDNKQTLRSALCENGKLIYFEAPEIFLSAYREVKHLCSIVKIDGNIQPRKIAFLVTTSWPYRKLINKYLMKFRTAGILNYFEKKFISREFPDTTESKFSSEVVMFEHIQLVLWGLCIMYVVSATICIIENIWFRFTNISKIQRIMSRRRSTYRRTQKIILPMIYVNNNALKLPMRVNNLHTTMN
ncbi:uncharacterized protein LOC103580893 [Microplitis demolitor]|uniref:uncharacterized protein LOC103580893 n=1 Tax=Microplitis demolitor TaxID=69319 RepID=UPI0004CCFB6A|nr:uncharacterized protein LOC103580893 [Microplitis demolitor]